MLLLITVFSLRSLTRTCKADAVITYRETPSNENPPPYTTSVDATTNRTDMGKRPETHPELGRGGQVVSRYLWLVCLVFNPLAAQVRPKQWCHGATYESATRGETEPIRQTARLQGTIPGGPDRQDASSLCARFRRKYDA